MKNPGQEFSVSRSDDECGDPKARSGALGLLLATMGLVAFGLTMLYSASSGDVAKAVLFFRNQLIWTVAGTAAGGIALLLGYRFLARRSLLWIGGITILLLWAAVSRPVNGARRWIHLGGYTFQPSEVAKIVAALFVAWYCSEYLRTFSLIRSRRGILPLLAGAGWLTGLILLGHDLGTTLLVAAMIFFTMWAAGMRRIYFTLPLVLLPLGVLYIRAFDQMRWLRMTVFLDPEQVQSGAGYQLWNSLLALGSGSWFGVGLMASRLKAKYLPEAHTDFILSIVGEELGLVGLVCVLLLYTFWGFCALRITLHARDRLGMLLGWALTLGVMMQAAINFGAMSGLFPTKGMPAPFISYGGSNLLGCLLATGLLLSVACEGAAPGCTEQLQKKLKRAFRFQREKRTESEY